MAIPAPLPPDPTLPVAGACPTCGSTAPGPGDCSPRAHAADVVARLTSSDGVAVRRTHALSRPLAILVSALVAGTFALLLLVADRGLPFFTTYYSP